MLGVSVEIIRNQATVPVATNLDKLTRYRVWTMISDVLEQSAAVRTY